MITIGIDAAVIKLPNFSEKEFDCKCGCGLNNMKSTFLWKLQLARTEAQIPFIVTSGFRCKKHNKDVLLEINKKLENFVVVVKFI